MMIEKLAISIYPYAFSLVGDEEKVKQLIIDGLTRLVMSNDLEDFGHFYEEEIYLEQLCYHLYQEVLNDDGGNRHSSLTFFRDLPYQARSSVFLKMKWHWSVEKIARVMKLNSGQVLLDLEQGRSLLYQSESLVQ